MPYDEITDMTEREKESARELNEALSVYTDVKDFFESDNKTEYLTSVLSVENVRKVLDEIEKIFIDHEEYEKCSTIQKWKQKLEKNSES